MTNQAPTKPQNGATAPLQPADQTPATPAEERALAFAIKIYALSPEGFVVEITSAEQTRPAVFISQRAGQHFEFWGCKVNGCRPKGDPK
jgi:hypothetical protein